MISSKNWPDRIAVSLIYIALSLLAVIVVYPFIHVVAVSLSDRGEALRAGFHWFPSKPTLESYRQLLDYPFIWSGYGNTLYRMVVGTSLTLLVTVCAAYPLSRAEFPLKKLFIMLLLFTMIFDGGIVPHYMLMKELHLLNTRWAYVLPTAANAFNVLVMISFFRSIPSALVEAARIDGARDLSILARIILPLSMPALVTIGLWSLVHHINAFMDNLLYVTDQSKYVLQQIVRQILIENELDPFTTAVNQTPPAPESLKMATVVVSALPVLVMYPFLLRYFEKGTMIGSVKG
ncbi:putative aldouronate transport system permease protein [Paenibacillus phyllosphaerae]|uniref:Putative aldouronate transport system permease protein n=1 Tax=Paenibacillus phyllosphaerae TaxID=274593 RepID=A0A7W5B2L1_9BACL|nr:carbohydrate ABC transporter permease [Paenibacillus phyllosphaerae]MBB3113300.1 putative aldouronate transport system permease protein [Paenibacillus phyllosphaerae]